MLLFQYDTDPVCVLCRCANENAEHLFTVCPYTYLLLRASPFEIIIGWNDWQQGNFYHDNLPSFWKELGYLYLTIVIYSVWSERNSRLHGKGSMAVNHLDALIKRKFREKLYSSQVFRRKLHDNPDLGKILY